MKKKFLIIGGILLLFGIIMTFCSFKYEQEVMGKASLGVAVFAPSEGSEEWNRKENLRERVDLMFYSGLVLMALGIVTQTVANISE